MLSKSSMSHTLLITGGAGFIGSHTAIGLKQRYPRWDITAFDNLSKRGSVLNRERLSAHGIRFVEGDCRTKKDYEKVHIVPSVIIHAAADPSVLSGLAGDAAEVVDNNLTGSLQCFEYARQCGAGVISLSSSRIYPVNRLNSLPMEEKETRFGLLSAKATAGVSESGISENFPTGGARTFYGSSKLAAELFLGEYSVFYGIKNIINRFGVVSGPWQMGGSGYGFIVYWMAMHLRKKPLKYLSFGGKGKQVRDVLHVNDLVNLLDCQIHHLPMLSGEIMNAGGGLSNSISLQELSALCRELTGNTVPVEESAEERPGDIKLYISDNSKVTKLTGWKPSIPVRKTVEDVYKWLTGHEKELEGIIF